MNFHLRFRDLNGQFAYTPGLTAGVNLLRTHLPGHPQNAPAIYDRVSGCVPVF
jgi:hypothetical protein